MSKRYFEILIDGRAIVELDDEVINVVDDEWRSKFYPLHTPEQIAEHVGYNLIINKWKLSRLSGWANQPNSNARIIEVLSAELDISGISREEMLKMLP